MSPPGTSLPAPAPEAVAAFQGAVWAHYRQRGRDLAWRRTHDPYHILVSEFMLQQTQVGRVASAYPRFLAQFPKVDALAAAPVADVLRAWQGLGYNRRALNLKRSAEMVCERWDGRIPDDVECLRRLPGVGRATAAAVAAFAFGQAHPFVETNIRAALIHHFVPEGLTAGESELLMLADLVLDRDDPRHWYYALMDYGAMLKQSRPGLTARSRSGRPQSPFAGSRRQLRARLLAHILASPGLRTEELQEMAGVPRSAEAGDVLDELEREGFVRATADGKYHPA